MKGCYMYMCVMRVRETIFIPIQAINTLFVPIKGTILCIMVACNTFSYIGVVGFSGGSRNFSQDVP